MEKNIYSVSMLVQKVQVLLEDNFSIVWIYGEISNFFLAASGHSYFTLKDDESQIASVIFKGQSSKIKFKLENGTKILGLARMSVYKPKGNYQLIFEHIEPYGVGSYQLAFEQTKVKLKEKGYFDKKYKKSLPFLPSCIALITSVSGSVIYDFFNVVYRRFPKIYVQIVHSNVQGEGADKELVNALNLVNKYGKADIIVVARGGGSIEDLAPFNSELLADAIFNSKIPVVSAVGHETDFTIADFVADLRAGTPSIAAELIVPEKKNIIININFLKLKINDALIEIINENKNKIKYLTKQLVNPKNKVENFNIKLDDLIVRLSKSFQNNLLNKQYLLDKLLLKFSALLPNKKLENIKLKTERLNNKTLFLIKNYINKKKDKVAFLSAKLEVLDPTSILNRGYSITVKNGKIVRYANEVNINEMVDIILAKGSLKCKVKKNK